MFSFFFQEHHEFLLGCIKEDLGFKAGKPIAACLIYKWLHQWGVFEAERTSIFDYIIEALNSVLKVGTHLVFFQNLGNDFCSLNIS